MRYDRVSAAAEKGNTQAVATGRVDPLGHTLATVGENLQHRAVEKDL